MRRSIVVWVALTACGAPARPDDPVDPVEVDAGDPPPAQVLGCTPVTPRATTLADDAVAAFAASGVTASASKSSNGYSLFLNIPLGDIAEPAQAALAMLTSLAGGPFVDGELSIALIEGSGDSKHAFVRRAKAGTLGTEFGGGLELYLRRVASSWRLEAVDVDANVMYATADEVNALRGCSRTPPSIVAVLAAELHGHSVSCAGPGAEYTYSAQQNDQVTLLDTPVWRALTDTGRELGAPLTQWHALFPARLLIDPSNFGLLPPGADCLCDDRAGFDMSVSSTKDVLLVRPGLGCIFC